MEIIKTDKFTTLKADKGKVLKNGETTACVITLKGDFSNWIEVDASTIPVDPELLVEAKEKKIMEIADYNTSDNVDAFLLNGEKHWLTLDERKAAELSTKAHITLGHETTEQCMGGVFYTIPCESLIYMLAELEIYALECLNHAKRQEAEVMAMTDIASVENYDVTAGCPEMLRFEL